MSDLIGLRRAQHDLLDEPQGQLLRQCADRKLFKQSQERTGSRHAAREEAVNDLFDYIKVFYNRSRRHSTLKSKSPVQFVQDWISAQHGQNMAT